MGVKFVRIPEEWRATCLTHPAEPPSAFLARVAACAGRARKTFAAAGISTTSAFMGLGMMSRFTEEGGGAELGPALQEVYSTLLSMPRPALPGGISLEWMSHPGGACKERAAGRAGCVGGGGADDFAASLCREGEEALLRDRTLLRMLRQDNWHLRPLHEAAAATAITAADGSYGDGRLRVVLLSQLRRATGNATTALRIRSLLVAAGCRVYSLDVDSIDGPGLAAFCEAQGAEAVVGIHAYRAGKTMSSLPFRIRTAIVLGGTDVHRDASDPSKAAAMNVALSRARVVVAFNAPLAEGGGKLLGATDCDKVMQVRQAVRIVPQGQALFDSDGNGGDTDGEGSAFDIKAELGLSQDARIVLLPAGWRRVKCPTYAAEAMSAWHLKDPRMHLVLVGPALEADVAEAVRGAAASLPGVHCLAELPREDLLRAMSDSVTVINTSSSEGECNVLLEAMGVGVPVVARSNAGNAALVRDETTGLLFDSPEGCVAAVRRVVSECGLAGRISAAARDFLLKEHSPEAEAATYAKIVDALRPPAVETPR
mmetsp:Transcript_8805/g.29117  ORF Transcript_8805/g.29117 Transcript_8805/m.29117 type:complete len:541 (-) Transcript_8805:62-1684(-)